MPELQHVSSFLSIFDKLKSLLTYLKKFEYMILIKPLSLFLTLSFIVVVDLQAQVGEKFYGKASYYADKFHGRSTSSGETYDRAEYTAAHRNLPFNTIVEVINTSNNRTAVVKINDRGPFIYNRMIDLSFAAAKDLDFLELGETDVEMKILSMDKSEYTILSFYAGAKGEFNREFNQYEPVIIIEKKLRVTSDTSYLSQTLISPSIEVKPIAEAFVIADSIGKQQADGEKMGFRQHKYIRVLRDGDGRYRLDSSVITSPTPQEIYSVTPQNTKFSTYKKTPIMTKVDPQKQLIKSIKSEVKIATKLNTEIDKVDNDVNGFRQYQYVKLYTDSESRTRVDTSQKTAALKQEATKPKEIYKYDFRQHSYIKVYTDKDGKTKFDTSSFERPK